MTTVSTVSVSSARPVTGSVLEDFIEKATAGLDANPAQLREKILPLLKADTTPEEALKHLISLSVSLTSAQTPDWKYAAGRLKMLEIYRQSGREPLYNYPQTLADNVAHGVYTDAIVRKYSAEEIAQAGALQAFHILNNFDIPIGVEFADKSQIPDMPSATQWTTVTDMTRPALYYRTMYNSRIRKVDLGSIDFSTVGYQVLPLDKTSEEIEQIRF